MHLAEHDDGGYTSVVMDHEAFPRHRFVVGLSPEGAVTGVSVADRRFERQDHEPAGTDPAWGPIAEVTRRLLAEVPFGELERAARARVNEDRRDIHDGTIELAEGTEWMRELPAALETPRRGGRRPLSDAFLARVASDYVQLSAGPSPITELARLRSVARNTAKGWVQEARRPARGLLTPLPKSTGPSGKAGGTLTPKALSLLRAEENDDA